MLHNLLKSFAQLQNCLLLSCIFYLIICTTNAQTRITRSISGSSDDQEEIITTGAFDEGSSDLELVTEGAGIQIIGLRFNNISLPQDAVVANAYLQFRADESNAEPTSLTIKIEVADNPATFTLANKISTRAKGDSVIWTDIPSWTVGEQGPAQRSPNLKSLLQSITDRTGWVKNNSVAFMLTGSGKRVADSFDDAEAARQPAALVIEYFVPVTIQRTVNFATDDMEEIITTGAVDEGSSDLELVTESKGQQLIGLRFNNITMPRSAVIQNASIQFRADEANAEPTSLTIRAQAADNPETFTLTNKLSTRTLVSDSIVWNNISPWSIGDRTMPQHTTDLAKLLQTLVNRIGWVSGNSVAFVITGSGKRVADAYEDTEATRAPAQLTVTYLSEDSEVVPVKPRFTIGTFPFQKGSIWKYNDLGQDIGTESWTATIFPRDSTWAFAPAPLGYRAPGVISTLSDSTLAKSIIRTTYFRNTFLATEVAQYDSLLFYLLADDGAVIYINGVEVYRYNMPTGAVSYNTGASGIVNPTGQGAHVRFLVNNTLLNNDTNTIAIELHQAADNAIDAIFDLQVTGKLPQPGISPFPIMTGSVWAAHDQGFELPTSWVLPEYNSSSWIFGKGPLGYGDPVNTLLSFGSDINNKYPTIYFRKEFSVADVAKLSDSLMLNIRRDDGSIIYINGSELLRSNMPTGTTSFATYSSSKTDGATETQFLSYKIPRSVLKNGTNTIAVEVHQDGPSSSDLTFDLELKSIPDAPVLASGCNGVNDLHIGCFTSVSPASKNDLLNIPTETHSLQMIVQSGAPYTIGIGNVSTNNDFTGYIPDGMTSSTKGHLSINHETNEGAVSLLDVHYDVNSKMWLVDSSRGIDFTGVAGTQRNCSGGVTPWGSVITCEETRALSDINGDGYQDFGWCVEIDPKTNKIVENGTGKPQKLWALGRASHENVVVLKDSLTVYWGEDAGDGILYKFVANQKMNLSAGILYAIRLNSGLVANEPTAADGTWIVVPNTTVSDRNNTFTLAKNLGATTFNGIEDVEINPLNGMIYFTAKGNERTYRFKDTGAGVSQFETFVGGMSYAINTGAGIITEPWGSGNDNLDFDDRGNLYVLQDGGQDHIWMVRPDHNQFNPKVEIFATTPIGSEPTGITFSPDHRFMFLSMQEPSALNSTGIIDASGKYFVFNKSTTLVIARKPYLEGQPTSAKNLIHDVGNIKVFPNPSEGPLTVEFYLSQPAMVKVEVLDMSGKIAAPIYVTQLPAGNNKAFISVNKSGAYLVKTTLPQGIYSEKVIIK